MRKIANDVYIPVLKELVEAGKEVSMMISGSSMNPFLIHQRDYILMRKPERELKVGDMVFFQRNDGAYVMHRIPPVISTNVIPTAAMINPALLMNKFKNTCGLVKFRSP